jgi:hypothetical protein
MFENYQGAKMTEFSEWLEWQICKSELTYQELIAMTGFTDTTIYRWCNGKTLPKLPHLIVLCEVFGKCQEKSPMQLVFEALLHIPEMKQAQKRFIKRLNNENK